MTYLCCYLLQIRNRVAVAMFMIVVASGVYAYVRNRCDVGWFSRNGGPQVFARLANCGNLGKGSGELREKETIP